MAETALIKVSGQQSETLQKCPECDNEYLAIRTDIYKDGREFAYCDCCGMLAPKAVWNRIQPAKAGLIQHCRQIAAMPGVYDALSSFSESPTSDGAAQVVQTILTARRG